ncbi:thiol-disulfide isomerase/thioredoxin [Mariniflexile fucanivorans]|uniref:Thiol-disulfide isomerase/thioredoxin n=1 Tax=Mariniflexile fucanivorans TaxID=264023 RepID=A0A4R1RLM2_9FLAO|nr:TlpA disulfide reductase family protein [Mariniflexile fucanivorans]TCL67006.1 thiol-disulfide isomerase/thioredoxin [Mariniflexile fucanivorans]
MKTILIKITSLFLLVLNLMACQPSADIFGKLEGVEKGGFKMYLIQPENLSEVAASYLGTVIDSAEIKPDGSFKFQNLPITKEPVLFELAIQESGKFPNFLENDDTSKSNYMPIVWQFGESIEITGNSNAFQKTFSIKNPSEENKSLLNLRDINQNAYQTYLEGKEWHVEIGEQLMAKEHAILQYQTALINFADNAQHFHPALVALRWVSPSNYYERVPEFLVRQCTKWTEAQPEHLWVQQLCKQSEPSNLPVLVGDTFPNLELPLITKDTIFINNALGKKLTIIDLWASWCAPCRKENRDVLVPIWNAYHNQGLQIMAYGLESDETAWKTAVEKDGAGLWFQASDLLGDDTPIMKQIRVQTIPANFILDANGMVLAKNIHGTTLIEWVKNYMENE